MKKSLLIAFSVALLAVSGAAFAEEANLTSGTPAANWQTKQAEMKAQRGVRQTEMKAAAEAKKAEMQQKRDEMLAQRCAKIQERIAERSGNIENLKTKHMSVYENMTDRISKFIEKLSGEGYDVSKIEADLVVLKEKIAKFSTDYAAQVAKLGETKNLACGHSNGEFKSGLAEARSAMKIVHADAMDIRKYMLNTVRPDIQALRKQKIETVKDADANKNKTIELN